MFGFFKRKKVPPAPSLAAKVAEVTGGILSAQGTMTGLTPEQLAGDRFALGYLMGCNDAMTQKLKLPEDEAFLVITAAYPILFPHDVEFAA